MIDLQKYMEIDPKKKGPEWGDEFIRHLRLNMHHVVDLRRANKAVTYLMSTYNTEKFKKMFKNADKLDIDFIPLAVLEKARNVFIAEMEASGINVNIKATDPSAINERQRDKELLENRKLIEAILSHERQAIGGPPYSLSNETADDGKKVYAGNVETFDAMGLDEDSSEDVGYFISFWHRLSHEIAAELAVQSYMSYNEVEDMIPKIVDDILTKKACAYRTYISDITGALVHKYVPVQNVRAMRGKSNNFKDARAISIEEIVSVGEFLSKVGNEFNWDRDHQVLIDSVNFGIGIQDSTERITGIMQGDVCRYGSSEGRVCGMDTFLSYTVSMGYIEFKSIDAKAYKVTEKNKNGNAMRRPASLNPETPLDPKSIYRRETFYNEVTYKSYYLVMGAVSQKLFKFGKLSYQEIEGAEDEYSNFSISVYAEDGPSFAEVCIPFVDMIVEAFFKFRYEIRKAKPRGRAYSFDSIKAVAKLMFPGQANAKVGIDEILKMFTESENEIYTIPEKEGKPVGGGNTSSYELPNGLSATVMQFQSVMDYGFGLIDKLIGISPIRDVYQPDARDGQRLQASVLEYSRHATKYIPRMMNSMMNNMGKRTLSLIQDVIAFKDKQSIPYKHLLNMLGDQGMRDLEALGNVSLHRYSIFVESFNSTNDRVQVKALTMQALQNKEIPTEVALLVDDIKSPRRAMVILAYEKKRQERMVRKNAIEMENLRQQGEAAKDKRQMDIVQLKGNLDNQGKNIAGEWLFRAYESKNATDLERVDKKADADGKRIEDKTDAAIKQLTAKYELALQQPESAV